MPAIGRTLIPRYPFNEEGRKWKQIAGPYETPGGRLAVTLQSRIIRFRMAAASDTRVGLIVASITEHETENGVFCEVSFERRDWKASHRLMTPKTCHF